MRSTNVIPIKAAPLPDCLILDSDTTFMVGTSLRSWQAGAAITDPADIALLEHAKVPRERYELIPEPPSPTPPGEEHDLKVAA